MFNFGAATIKFNDTSLGSTMEGGSLSPHLISLDDVDVDGNLVHVETLTGGTGIINFYDWSSMVALLHDTTLNDWGVLEIEMPRMKITLHHAKMLVDLSELNFGTWQQKPFKVKVIFNADQNGNIITMEEV